VEAEEVGGQDGIDAGHRGCELFCYTSKSLSIPQISVTVRKACGRNG